jgi:predicted lipoprotein
MESIAGETILSHMSDFESRTEKLGEDAVAFCEAPSEELLTAVRDSWWTAKEALKRFEIVQFGPIKEYPGRLGPKLDDWPVNEAAVDELVEGDAPLGLEDFQSKGTATRGMPVVEYLLWSRGEQSLVYYQSTQRACEALVGASLDVHSSASQLKEQWKDTWVSRLTQPALDDEDDYDSIQDVLDEWVSRMAFTVENIRKDKLGKPVGDSAGGEPQPDTIESFYSTRSLGDAYDALSGVQDVWSGGSVGQLGVRDLLTDREEPYASVTSLLETSLERVKEIPEPLEQAILLDREIIARAQEALLALQVAVQVDLAQALSVTIAFNDNDGD